MCRVSFLSPGDGSLTCTVSGLPVWWTLEHDTDGSHHTAAQLDNSTN